VKKELIEWIEKKEKRFWAYGYRVSQLLLLLLITYQSKYYLQFPLPLKLCEVDMCNPLKVLLTLPLPLGPEPASPNALIVLEVEHELAPGKEHPPPLHAILPLFVIQLACAVCTICTIMLTTLISQWGQLFSISDLSNIKLTSLRIRRLISSLDIRGC
jgi:hypothetical protein